MTWIKCSDKLPADDDYVLAYSSKAEACCLAYYMGKNRVAEKGWYIVENDFAQNIRFVSHWQPLPEPPEEE